jgi:hypothetical protein
LVQGELSLTHSWATQVWSVLTLQRVAPFVQPETQAVCAELQVGIISGHWELLRVEPLQLRSVVPSQAMPGS